MHNPFNEQNDYVCDGLAHIIDRYRLERCTVHCLQNRKRKVSQLDISSNFQCEPDSARPQPPTGAAILAIPPNLGVHSLRKFAVSQIAKRRTTILFSAGNSHNVAYVT